MMSEEVCITFRSRIHPGESSFVVPVQRKFIDKRFGVESITLMPEYQNTQAYVYNLDSKKELEEEINFPLQLQVSFLADYYTKDEAGKTWSYLTSQTRIDKVMVSVNQHFDKYKPSGTFYPPVFFDWIHLEGYDEDQETFIETEATNLYSEAFNAAKHAAWLPNSLSSRDEINKFIFPTTNKAEVLDVVRLRMWVAPNTTVTFSNKNLPLALGFQEAQIPAKNKRGQVPFVNDDPTQYKMFFVHDPPKVDVTLAELRGTKMNCYTTKDFVMSPMGQLVSQKQMEFDPVNLCRDFAKGISTLAKTMNIYMDLKFDDNEKKFQFVFPQNNSISVRVFVPPTVFYLLGYDPSYGDFINERSVSSPVPRKVDDTENLAKKALALVYDTGMVAVDLDDHASYLNSYSGSTLMATLYPRADGTLRNRIVRSQVARVNVSQTNPHLNFILYRFDDYNNKSKLGWPVGAYVFGTLTGIANSTDGQ
jgi:hypothetical protein